ncbi:rab-GTPase-TBC domain-containing protein [Mrakia frigida]|uniref:rab-GTPase-TBC domain-containing protein n=1 Tax=Mrakia frigida TaxID=29902 RepID=UPI003FCC0D28
MSSADVGALSLPSPPPLPSFNRASSAASTSSASSSRPTSPRPSSPSSDPNTPTPSSRTIRRPQDSEDDFTSIPFEDIAISEDPPSHPVNGTSGGSGGSLEENKKEKRSSWQARAHSPRISISLSGRPASISSPPPGHGRNGSLSTTPTGSKRNSLQVQQPPVVPAPSPLSRTVPIPVVSSPPPEQPTASSSSSSSSNALSAPSSAISSRKPSPQPGLGKHSSGPSKFEQVMSKTRPVYLPPKDREEDMRHLKDWEKMMKTSAQHEKQRKLALQHAREARAAHQAALLPTWTQSILKSPRTSVAADSRLRAVWWEGIPPRYRGDLWERVGGNKLGLSTASYASHVRRFEISLERQAFPKTVLAELEKDASSAYPGLKLFKKDGAMYAGLREFLGAWVVARSDEGLSYASGVHLLAATLLLNMPPQSAWITLLNLLSSSGCLRAFYDPGSTAEQQAYYRVLNTLCSDALPKVYYNLMSNGVKIPETWFRTLFIEQLPFDVASRVWDQIFLDGDSFIFRTCIAILRTLEHRLYDPDASELRAVLQGRSLVAPPPASTLDGPRQLRAEMVTSSVEIATEEEALSGTGGIYGIDEARLFRELEQGEWKDSAFERLVKRELDSAA